MNKLKSVAEIAAYYAGMRVGLELGANLDPGNYSHILHSAKRAELVKIDQAEHGAVIEFNKPVRK